MGNNCAPDKKKDEAAPVTDMDKQAAVEEAQESGAQPGEKLTQVINAYQAENERLKKEVEEMKTQQTERQAQEQAGAADSDALLMELNTMRGMLKEKDQAVVRSNLQAALFARANTMKDAQNAATSLKKDTLKKFGKAGKGSAKTKFVEVSLHKGTRTAGGFEPGMIRLSYAETEGASVMSTGRVTKVKTAENMKNQWKDCTFTVEAMIDGASKDLVFACEDTEARDAWVATFQKGFNKIRDEAESMRQHFKLTLSFTKDKLGIRVEEKVLDQEVAPLSLDEKKEDDIPAPAAAEEDKADTATAEDIPAPAPEAEKESYANAEKEEGEAAADDKAAPAAGIVFPPIDDPAEEGEAAAEPAPAEEAAEAAEEKEADEPPCTLVVTAISDTDLKEKGLRESMALLKLNDTDIDGMAYSKQLNMLTTTDKPFTITFTGPNFLKLGQDNLTVFPAILKQLTAAESNDAQVAFKSIISGSQFETELNETDDKHAAISELLGSQHKLSNLLQAVTTQSADL